MILIFKKYIIPFLLLLSLTSVILMGYGLYRLGLDISFPDEFDQIWWSLYTSPDPAGLPFKLLSLIAQPLYALIFMIILGRRVRRNPSAELSFFYIFLFTFSLQIFRLSFLSDSSFLSGGDFSTRIIYFGRLLALSCLFAASLFSTGLQIQKFGQVLLICFLMSFTLSSLLPVNSSISAGSLLHRIAREKHLAFFCICLEILTVLNYIAAAHNLGRNEYYRLSLLSLIVIAGYEMLFFLYPPFAIPGAICLITGTLLFMGTIRRLFLWS